MIDEKENITSEEQNPEVNYLEIIKDYKENYVSKEKYNKVIADNNALTKMFMEDGNITVAPQEAPAANVDELRQALFTEHCELNNLQYVSKALELREALMSRGEADPFLPIYSKDNPTAEDVEKAENAASVFKECIEYADGDSQLFTQELMRRTVDVRPTAGRRAY